MVTDFLGNMLFSKFPHFIRRFSASFVVPGIKSSLWLLIYVALLTNLLGAYIFETDEEKLLRYRIMENPKEASLHEKLGQYYLTINEKEAQKEYLLAQEYYLLLETQKNNVLGVQKSPWERWTEIASSREKLKQQIKYWEKIHRKFPSYIYAALKLATLNYQLGDKEKARMYLETIHKETPDNSVVFAFLERLK